MLVGWLCDDLVFDWLTDSLLGYLLLGKMVGWLVDWLTGRLVGWSVGWFVDWLGVWLAKKLLGWVSRYSDSALVLWDVCLDCYLWEEELAEWLDVRVIKWMVDGFIRKLSDKVGGSFVVICFCFFGVVV